MLASKSDLLNSRELLHEGRCKVFCIGRGPSLVKVQFLVPAGRARRASYSGQTGGQPRGRTGFRLLPGPAAVGAAEPLPAPAVPDILQTHPALAADEALGADWATSRLQEHATQLLPALFTPRQLRPDRGRAGPRHRGADALEAWGAGCRAGYRVDRSGSGYCSCLEATRSDIVFDVPVGIRGEGGGDKAGAGVGLTWPAWLQCGLPPRLGGRSPAWVGHLCPPLHHNLHTVSRGNDCLLRCLVAEAGRLQASDADQQVPGPQPVQRSAAQRSSGRLPAARAGRALHHVGDYQCLVKVCAALQAKTPAGACRALQTYSY